MTINTIQNNIWRNIPQWATKAAVPALLAAAYFFSPSLYPQNGDELTGRCTIAPPDFSLSFGQCPNIYNAPTSSQPDWLKEASDTDLTWPLNQALFRGDGLSVRQALLKFPDYQEKEWAFGQLAANDDTQSIRFLVESGIVDSSDFESALLWSARGNAHKSLNYLVPLSKKEHIHRALLEAAKYGHLPSVKACMQGKMDLEDVLPQALHLAVLGGYLPVVQYLTHIYEQSPATLGKALFTAAQKGHASVVKHLCKLPVSEEMRNKALNEAAQFKHWQAFAALIDAGADLFVTETTSNFAFETGFLPSEDTVASLSLDKQYKSLIAHFKKGPLSSPLLKLLQDNFVRFDPQQKFHLLESLFDQNVEWVLSQIPLLEPEHQFLIARLSLLKNCSQSPSFKALLNPENQKAIELWEQRIAVRNGEHLALKQQILANDHSLSERPSQEAWETEAQGSILSHKERILQFIDHKRRDGVKVYKECLQINVFEFDVLPGLIFKTFDIGSNEAEMRYQQSKAAIALCKKENLHRIRIPYSTIIPAGAIGNTNPILIEEKQFVLDRRVDYQERVQFMSRDPELSPILKETFRQATVFISRTGYYDPRFNNAPLLKDGTGMALVDIDSQGAHPSSGIYTFQPSLPTPLVYSVDEENIDTLRNTLLEIDADRFKDFEFDQYEEPRRDHLAMLKHREEVLLKRGILDNDPIPFDLLDEFSPDEQEMAKKIIAAFNGKLANKKYFGDLRALHMSEQDKIDITGIGADYHQNLPIYNRVMDVLQRKEIIFHIIDNGGHGKTYYC